MGYAVVGNCFPIASVYGFLLLFLYINCFSVPVCSSASDEPGETKVNVEFQLRKDEKTESHCYSLTLKEFQVFLRDLSRTTDTALSAISSNV